MVEREWCLPEPCQRKEVILWKYACEAKFVSFNGKKCNEGNYHIFTCQPDILFIILFKKKLEFYSFQCFHTPGVHFPSLFTAVQIWPTLSENTKTQTQTRILCTMCLHTPLMKSLWSTLVQIQNTLKHSTNSHTTPFKIPDRRPNVCGQAGKHKT